MFIPFQHTLESGRRSREAREPATRLACTTLHCRPDTSSHKNSNVNSFMTSGAQLTQNSRSVAMNGSCTSNTNIAATVPLGLHYGWVEGLRRINREGRDDMTVVQDAVIYKRWMSREAEERLKTAIPRVKREWDDGLRRIGTVEAREEHIDLLLIGLGMYRKPRRAPMPESSPGEPA